MALLPVNFIARKVKPYRSCSVSGCNEEGRGKRDLCTRHRDQITKCGKILERTIYNPNAIEVFTDYALLYLYDKHCNVIAKAVIDLDDVVKVRKYKWHYNEGYVENRKMGKIHNIVMGVRAMHDHKNNNPLDNRKENLRQCVNKQNSQNRSISKKMNTSGAKGVYYDKRRSLFVTRVGIDKKMLFIGYYKNVVEAAIAYNEAAKKYFGEFAKLNCIISLKLREFVLQRQAAQQLNKEN